MKVKITLTDDKGEVYVGEAELKKSKKSNASTFEKPTKSKGGFKKGSVADNLNHLIKEGYFDSNRTIRDMINELRPKDIHYKPSDLTRPLRRFVRSGRLKKTKDLQDGTKSIKWTYIKNQ